MMLGVFVIIGAILPGISETIPPETHTIHINSPGGSAAAGYELGRHLRNQGIHLVVDGTCDSACAFAALGAKSREGTFCFHLPYNSETGKPAEIEQMRTYLKDMRHEKLADEINSEWLCLTDKALASYEAPTNNNNVGGMRNGSPSHQSPGN